MYLVNKILNWFLFQGVHQGLTETQRQDVKFINREALTAFIVSLPCVPMCYISLPNTNDYLILFCIFCFYFSSIFFNKFQLYGYAKSSILLVAEIGVFWAASTFGNESNLHYIFIIIAFATIVNFQKNEKIYLYSVLGSIVALLLILYFTNFSLLKTEQLDASQINIAQQTSFYLCFVGSIIMAFFYINKFTKQRQKINDYNQELEQKFEELQKLNKELDRFVYSVSHDLRAPITSVLGLIYLSRRSESFEEVRQYMDLQEKSLKKLDNFIADILHYSRNNRMEINAQEVDFQEELENILELQNQYDPNIKIETKIEVKQEVRFSTDKQRLVIVLNNLIGNAFRYYNPYQKKSFIHLVANISIEKAIIKITDNGIGIGKEHIDKIFGMFYRATDKTAGSGLGLYIVKEVIEKLKGKISVESELGKGTTFTIEIPNLKTENPPS